MTVEQNLEFVRQAYDAMARADIPWMHEHTSPDVVFQQGGRFLGQRKLTFDEVHVWRLQDGLLVEMHAVPFDPYEIDEFFAKEPTAAS
jgi:hypothetical protein